MNAILLAALVAAQGAPDDPSSTDAPRAVTIHRGDAAPGDGVFMPTPAALHLANTYHQCQLENEGYVKQLEAPQGWQPRTGILVGGGLLAVGLGVVLGLLVAHR